MGGGDYGGVVVDVGDGDGESFGGAGAIAGGGFDDYVVAGGVFVIKAVASGERYYAGVAGDAE